MDQLADLRDEGYDAEKLVAWAEENKLKSNNLLLFLCDYYIIIVYLTFKEECG